MDQELKELVDKAARLAEVAPPWLWFTEAELAEFAALVAERCAKEAYEWEQSGIQRGSSAVKDLARRWRPSKPEENL